MTNPDVAPPVHQPLDTQLSVAQLELDTISNDLWLAAGYNRDLIKEALDCFPLPSRRRSDTPFTCEPEHEDILRTRAADLGPGRRETESLEDLGVYSVDAEVIEPGQLHKTVAEVWRALVTGQQAPIIVFASDRKVPKWKTNDQKQEDESKGLDAERQSTDRLLTIGGQGLATSSDFFYRAGGFDSEARSHADDDEFQEARTERAISHPNTEYDITEKFLAGALDERSDKVLPIGYDPNTGQLSDSTGQVRSLGKINGRDVILVHKEAGTDGSLDTTSTVLLMGRIAATITATPETIIGYWTSATYKPSRWMSGIRAGILAAQANQKLRVAVPTYGYADLSKIKGESESTPPTIQNIAGELGKAAAEALELRDYLDSLRQ